MHMFALHPTSTSPCSCASCKEEVSLVATRQERQKREASSPPQCPPSPPSSAPACKPTALLQEPYHLTLIHHLNQLHSSHHQTVSLASSKAPLQGGGEEPSQARPVAHSGTIVMFNVSFQVKCFWFGLQPQRSVLRLSPWSHDVSGLFFWFLFFTEKAYCV